MFPMIGTPLAFCTFNVVESATTGTIGTISQTNVILTEEEGVQSKCDGGTMSAALNINTDSDALLYTGVTKEDFLRW